MRTCLASSTPRRRTDGPRREREHLHGTTRALRRLVLAIACSALPATAQDAGELRNWFDDPFFQASAFVRGCPEPLGPRSTRGEMEREAHVRAERGTRCYLEGQCTKANSYQYDRGIATELERALGASGALHGTTVWVTVQRRWVWLQGCVPSATQRRQLEAIAHRIPDVERVFVELGDKARPRYRTLSRNR